MQNPCTKVDSHKRNKTKKTRKVSICLGQMTQAIHPWPKGLPTLLPCNNMVSSSVLRPRKERKPSNLNFKLMLLMHGSMVPPHFFFPYNQYPLRWKMTLAEKISALISSISFVANAPGKTRMSKLLLPE